MSSFEICAFFYILLFMFGFFFFSVQRTALLIEREFWGRSVGLFLTSYETSTPQWGAIFVPSWVSFFTPVIFCKIAVLVFMCVNFPLKAI